MASIEMGGKLGKAIKEYEKRDANERVSDFASGFNKRVGNGFSFFGIGAKKNNEAALEPVRSNPQLPVNSIPSVNKSPTPSPPKQEAPVSINVLNQKPSGGIGKPSLRAIDQSIDPNDRSMSRMLPGVKTPGTLSVTKIWKPERRPTENPSQQPDAYSEAVEMLRNVYKQGMEQRRHEYAPGKFVTYQRPNLAASAAGELAQLASDREQNTIAAGIGARQNAIAAADSKRKASDAAAERMRKDINAEKSRGIASQTAFAKQLNVFGKSPDGTFDPKLGLFRMAMTQGDDKIDPAYRNAAKDLRGLFDRFVKRELRGATPTPEDLSTLAGKFETDLVSGVMTREE